MMPLGNLPVVLTSPLVFRRYGLWHSALAVLAPSTIVTLHFRVISPSVSVVIVARLPPSVVPCGAQPLLSARPCHGYILALLPFCTCTFALALLHFCTCTFAFHFCTSPSVRRSALSCPRATATDRPHCEVIIHTDHTISGSGLLSVHLQQFKPTCWPLPNLKPNCTVRRSAPCCPRVTATV